MLLSFLVSSRLAFVCKRGVRVMLHASRVKRYLWMVMSVNVCASFNNAAPAHGDSCQDDKPTVGNISDCRLLYGSSSVVLSNSA